ncbi:hypothetical protein J3E72DRAFT_355104 [Bipolaris maydis]|uniref:uncharacterized protein n=1 Tax=Cochliobolus heterostrophus TaxID=5016 RepID=UPI0024DBDEE6|nr:hypothetical protein J3E73DRAFT_340571 [Bipolaris maydis]KAJ5064737.1 hypothetical protein J3E74DRAFT_315062 [Bipolaris maydis]KAJ6193252.1 hypothetical protein J3E72DRAFT_355104 [Bipolaris maydis]KAJ6205353.1 hypothetical protein PSV09DRAFT_2343668 [Bipolaris maydis]KAJ6267842.1 hypothetical protein PSV08DRAFT_322278 [Bipolaris maydis]
MLPFFYLHTFPHTTYFASNIGVYYFVVSSLRFTHATLQTRAQRFLGLPSIFHFTLLFSFVWYTVCFKRFRMA